MSDKEKRHYEPPTLLLLGEIDKGVGVMCFIGGLAAVPQCGVGSADAQVCTAGPSAVLGTCRTGPANVNPYDI
jgi:hypothetical protein